MFSTDHITYNSKKKTERLEMVTVFRKSNIFMCAKEYRPQEYFIFLVKFLTERKIFNFSEFFEGELERKAFFGWRIFWKFILS